MTKILLVDDDEMVRFSVAEVLQEADYEVETVSSGREAIARLGWGLPDLIVTDLVMDNGDGYELITHVRKHCPALPLIAISGGFTNQRMGMPSDFLDMSEAMGAASSLAKPFTEEQLLQCVERVLASK